VIRLRQSQLENAIALYQALGGGWQAATTPVTAPVAAPVASPAR
jgi:outer membrane protein TolC